MEETFSNPDGNIHLTISEDGLTCEMIIDETTGFISEEDILTLIKEAAIVEGIELAVQTAEEEGITKAPGVPFPLAIGISASEPLAEFSPVFDTGNCIDPDFDTTDFSALDSLERVIAGQSLAHLYITRQGKSGKTVTGVTLEPMLNEEDIICAYIGEGVSYDEQNSTIVAKNAGYPYLDTDNRVHIKSDFTIDTDLDRNFDSFSLFGNLTVNGEIKDKIIVTVTGNLTVNGDINDATLNVEGNLKVNGDILNCRSGGITVNGNLEFESAEHAHLFCSRRIKFSHNAHFCKLIAEKGIYGNEETSSVVGGQVQSGEQIEAAIIGNSSAIGTELEITICPFTKELLLVMTHKLMKLNKQPGDNKEQIEALRDKLDTLEDRLEDSINRILNEEDDVSKHLIAFKKLFPGTYFRILKKSITIAEEQNRVCYSITDGDLTGVNYD
ncbi:MAG: FapA family protein [Candidatus Cloacimonetes bacterium]|nr:FapA family protein [Candidatus Cloacimonadota bacterium]